MSLLKKGSLRSCYAHENPKHWEVAKQPRVLVGCNNGGGGGYFSNVNRLIAKLMGTLKRIFSDFFDHKCVILETQEIFFKAYFTYKPIYAYLSLFMSSSNMQEHWDSDLFRFGDG